ncbi:DUF5103 domain-containing protein [Flavobacteriaceae bacterium F08102]|nr:DUF5103 domain-containing protein [Flavobacteriaceae bacterium F08102]
MKRLSTLWIANLFYLACSYALHAQLDVLVDPPAHIKSITFHNQYINDFSPMVKLGDQFTISFDDLGENQQDYTYRITHCDYNWEPSKLSSTEFIDGYSADRIRDFESSFNTFQPYTHYSFSIPNEHTALKISGNYIVSVLNEDDEIVFSRAFMVYEPLVSVAISAHKSKTISDINAVQRLEVLVDYPNLRINNPNKEIKLVIIKNYDWHEQIKNIVPQYHRGTQLIYNQNELTFGGGNEFLYFDTKEIRNPVNKIARVQLDDIFNTYLYSDEPRADVPYTYYPDINGNFSIRTIDSDDSALEADYSKVHFSLQTTAYPHQDLYVYGNFNNWKLTEENKMTYHPTEQRYTATLLLKQGFYNYTYIAQDKQKNVHHELVEGSFYQTENDYAVFVYHRPFGSRYDRIIGVGKTKVEKLRN